MAFRFPAQMMLDEYLGKVDAIMALNEVAALEFLEKAQTGAGEDIDTYLTDRAHERGIYLTRAYAQELSVRRYRYYIVQVHEALEAYCDAFQREHEECFGRWAPRDSRDPKLFHVLANVPGGQLKNQALVRCMEYYRAIRNFVAHGSTDEKKFKEKWASKLGKLRADLQAFFKRANGFPFDAPNNLESLKFDDALLFSSIVLKVAREISVLAKPDPRGLLRAAFIGTNSENGRGFQQTWNLLAHGASDAQRKTRRMKALVLRLVEKWSLNHQESRDIVDNHTSAIAQW